MSGQPVAKAPTGGRLLGGTTNLGDTRAYPNSVVLPGPVAIPAGGVAVAAGADLQSVIDSHAAGTQFNLAAGTYRGGIVHPKTGDRFYGVKAGPGGTVLQGIAIHRADSSTTNVEIHNVSITGYADSGHNGAVDSNYHESGAASGWKLTNSEISGNTVGASLGPSSLVENNTFHDNSCRGAAGGMNATTWRYNQFFRNEPGAPDPSGECGGTVLTGVTGNVFVGNLWSGNGHPAGLWMYGASHDNTFDGNISYNNAGSGLLDQTGHGNTLRNNIVAGNGKNTLDAWRRTGIVIESSAHDTVTGNSVWGNGGAVLIYMESRSDASGLDRNAYNSVTGNVVDKAVDIASINVTGPNTVESNRVVAAAAMQVPAIKAGPQA